MVKEFGQFGQNLAKSGQTLKKITQQKLRFHSSKCDFLELE
jgi:hypothetical protein